jgi:hypothetical protein
MDQRIESFLADVLALAGENPDAIREGGSAWRSLIARRSSGRRRTNKRMRDQAARVCRALCRTRVAEELQRRSSIIDRRQER